MITLENINKDQYDPEDFEMVKYAIENDLIADKDYMRRAIEPGASELFKMILYGVVYEHKGRVEFYKEKRKSERVDDRWTDDEKLKNCGRKTGDYHTEDGPQPFIYSCRQYDRCDSCRQRKATEARHGIERAANKTVSDNPKMKLRHLKNLPQDKAEARLKRIKRNGGTYRRKDNGDGTVDIFTAIEDNPKKSPEQNQEIFGAEIEPELVYDEKETFKPYERFNLSDMQEYFEDATTTNRMNNTKWSGKLNHKPDSDKSDRIRYTVIVPKSASDWQKKKEIDKELGNPETATLETTTIPIQDVADNEEYQKALDLMATGYIEKYQEAKINFEIKSIFKHVKADKFEDWNIVAATNRMIYEIKCPNKDMDIANEVYPYSNLDILPEMEQMKLL